MFSEKALKKMLAKTLGKNYTEEEQAEAYKIAKEDTLKKFPKMYAFFEALGLASSNVITTCAESTEKSENKGDVKKVDD